MTDLRSQLAALKAVNESRLADALASFRDPLAQQMILFDEAPTADELKARLFQRKSLSLWEIWPDGKSARAGYVGVRLTGGPLVYLSLAQFDQELAEDVVLAATHHYFNTLRLTYPKAFHNDGVFLHLPHTQADALHDFLLSNGFDPLEKFPTVDGNVLRTYVLELATYQAYHTETEEDAP